MDHYIYSPLPHGSIRLLQLMPDQDEYAVIQCRLLTFPLHQPTELTTPYEALSYAWGFPNKFQNISIEGRTLAVLENLHGALSRLRDRFVERVIWAGAICINQSDVAEKLEQVRLTPEIYIRAERTICWVPSELSESALRLVAHFQQFRHRVAHRGSLVSESDLYHSEYEVPASVLESFRRDLRFDNAEAWRSLNAFLDDPYFQRLWVMPDWISSKLPVLVCVSHELSWEGFCNALEVALFYSTNNSLSSSGLLSVVTAGHLRKRRNFSSGQALSYKDYVLAQQTCTYAAVDARDYVFAIRSMIQDTDSIEDASLIWDYSLSVSETYTRAAQELGLLSLSQTKRSTPLSLDLPSWAPDWSRPLGRFLLNHTRSNFSASQRPQSFGFNHDGANPVLRCGCLQVDMVLKVSSYLPPRRHFDHYNVDGANIIIFDEWFEFATHHTNKFRRTPRSEVEVLLQYADTIQARGCNSIWESNTPRDANHLAKKTRDFIHFLRDEIEEATMDIRLFYAACFPSHDRRFGVTKRGYFCLVPQETRQGDLVCIPHGNMVPIIFRGQGRQFKNLGEAYINGLMSGEGEVLDGLKDTVLEVV